MIVLYSGTPGSGKSLHTASTIYWRLKRNLPVIANFEIDEKYVSHYERFTFIENSDLTVDWLVKYSADYFGNRKVKEGSITLIIDECQLLFDCRSWNAKGRENWIKFFSQHRKLGYNIILVAQFDKMIDRQIRSLIEYEYIHRKVSNFGWKGKLISIWTMNRLFVSVQMWYPIKTKVASEFYLYKKRLGNMYNTFNMFDPDKNTKRQEVETDLSQFE